MHPTYRALLATVVVGSVTPTARYPPDEVVHEIDWAVPLSLMRIVRRCPSTGMPEGAAKRAEAARAVTLYWLVVPAEGVIVPALPTATVSGW